ncbi:MAG: recombinase [Mesorhizobium sp.]|nr:MAG: recombinase [Mesorhizobium sp.]TIQ06781.1 MAG: recombinase [Mesorhizobium sp.]TIR48657.1 MAG: recombinase [Mesorhizobium sp.]TJV94706.1 MAG: recombinase [Mesorhizobium sp.]
MSARFGMEPAAFEATVRATCMKPDKNGKVPSREEFAAFLLVAKEYKLNPLTKEIYAFAAKGGGIVPIVSLDGWANLINSHPAMDGVTFAMEHNDEGALVSCTCRIYRKDRSHPIEVTEYLSECIRNTEPWQMKHRMLRHKSLIQCARYAFGFSGIYDEDEGAKIAGMKDVTPPAPPKPPVPPSAQISGATETIDAETGEILDEREVVTETGEATDAIVDETIDDNTFFERLEEALAVVSDLATVEEIWTDFDPLARFEGKPAAEINQSIALAIRKRAEKRIGGSNGKA